MENRGKTIDLHVHSRGSTGKCSVSDIVFHAMHQNPEGMVLAITDHDSFAMNMPQQMGDVLLLPAIEMTCLRAGVEIHLIMIYPEGVSNSSAIVQMLQSMNRNRYAEAVLDMLNRKQVSYRPLTMEDILERNPDSAGYLRAPNFAHALVQMGICASRDDAMDRYVGKYAKHPINHLDWNEYPTMEQAIEAACKDRAILILAHPFVYYGKDLEATEALVADFRSRIPDDITAGLEVYYKKSYEDSEILETWAEKYRLFESVGSDAKRPQQALAEGAITFWEAMYHDWKEKSKGVIRK